MSQALSIGCPGVLSPICDPLGGIGSTVLGSGLGALFSALAEWVVDGARWLLDQVGAVLSASTSVNVNAAWFAANYRIMIVVAAWVAVPMLVLAAIQAVCRQSAAPVARALFVHLPLAALLTFAAVKGVGLALAATDALCRVVSSGAGSSITRLLTQMAAVLVSQLAGNPGGAPTFVVLLVAFLVVCGALALWLELLVRAAGVYAALLFLPLALATVLWPAVAHWCRRLVETLAALVVSKFVIVAILALGVEAAGAGTQHGISSVLSGAAMLLLAAFTPFTLLRLVPAIEAGAVLHLDGARHRALRATTSMPRNAAAFAYRQAVTHGRGTFTPGRPGTGMRHDPGQPGSQDAGGPSGQEGSGSFDPGGTVPPDPGGPLDAAVLGTPGFPHWVAGPSLRMDPDGRARAYAADGAEIEVPRLTVVPLDGLEDARPNDVEATYFHRDGMRVTEGPHGAVFHFGPGPLWQARSAGTGGSGAGPGIGGSGTGPSGSSGAGDDPGGTGGRAGGDDGADRG